MPDTFSFGTLAEPFQSQDQNPFSLINGQPQPLSANLPAAGGSQWSLGLDITNTLNAETSAVDSILLDYESYLVRFAYLYGLTQNWALMLDIPLVERGSGFLDNTIDNWHRAFGLPRAERPKVADNQFRITYINNGVTEYDIATSTEGLGDIQLGLGNQLHKSSEASAAIWLVADLPSGDRNRLTGNDALDLSLLLAGSYQLSPGWNADTNLGIVFPGNHQFGALKSEDSVIFGHAGLQWSAHPLFDLRLQFGGHAQYYSGSDLKPLGKAFNIIFGGTLHLDKCSDLDLAVSEDIAVGTTPDVSFLFSWRHKTGDCSKS